MCILKLVRNQKFFISRIKGKLGPKPGNDSLRIKVDAINKSTTSKRELIQVFETRMLREVFAHPFPEPLNRVEIR